jgi:hypothetical protein
MVGLNTVLVALSALMTLITSVFIQFCLSTQLFHSELVWPLLADSAFFSSNLAFCTTSLLSFCSFAAASSLSFSIFSLAIFSAVARRACASWAAAAILASSSSFCFLACAISAARASDSRCSAPVMAASISWNQLLPSEIDLRSKAFALALQTSLLAPFPSFPAAKPIPAVAPPSLRPPSTISPAPPAWQLCEPSV